MRFMYSVIGVQLGMYYTFSQGILSDSYFIADYARRFEIWRYFTVALVHDGLLHLFTNIAYQFLYGKYLENKFGWRKIAIIYFSGTAFGELFANATTPSAFGVGASAGVYGLQMAYVASWIMQPSWSHVKYVIFTLVCALAEPLLVLDSKLRDPFLGRENYAMLSLMGIDLHWNSYAAHSGGAIIGFVLGFACLAPIEEGHSRSLKTSKKSEKKLKGKMQDSKSRPLITHFQSAAKFLAIVMFVVFSFYNLTLPALSPVDQFFKEFGLGNAKIGFFYLFSQGILNDAHFIADYARRFEIWRYFTVTLVHDGALHLLMNLMYQLLYGKYLESKVGWRKVALIFWLGSAFGELFANSTAPSAFGVGASGAICALRMAYLGSWMMQPNLSQLQYAAITLISVLTEPLMVLDSKLQNPFLPPESYKFLSLLGIHLNWNSCAAHSGGAIIGFFLGFACLTPNEEVHSKPLKTSKNSSRKLKGKMQDKNPVFL